MVSTSLLPQINPDQVTEDLGTFLRHTLAKTGFSDVVIGLSGGIDSAVTYALALRALGHHFVHPVALPYSDLGAKDVADARNVVESCGAPADSIHLVDIRPAVHTICSGSCANDNIRLGNVMARVRMTYIFDYAKATASLVLGTENRSEHLLGYYTRFGDAASDIELIRALYKTQVYDLARYLKIPEIIISKQPSARLWTGQTDEDELGFSYLDADQILHAIYDRRISVSDLVQYGWSEDVVRRVIGRAERMTYKLHLPHEPPTSG